MAFWGCEVKPGKATPFVPPPEAHKLHLSQACLSTKAKPGTKAALKARVGCLLLSVCWTGGASRGALLVRATARAACRLQSWKRRPSRPALPPLPLPQVRVGQEGGELLVCALREGLAESASLDLLFDE